MNVEVAIVKTLCPVCCAEIEDTIMMNTLLTEETAKEVKELNGKVIGFSDHCCEECTKHKDEVVYFVGIDAEKSSSNKLEKLYRTGQIVGIKKEADIIEAFKDYIITLKDNTKICFIDEACGIELGMFKTTEEEK